MVLRLVYCMGTFAKSHTRILACHDRLDAPTSPRQSRGIYGGLIKKYQGLVCVESYIGLDISHFYTLLNS